MNKQIEALRSNTDRRFAILMTGLEDFMAAYQQERNQIQALLNIDMKVAPSLAKPETPKQKKARLRKEAAEKRKPKRREKKI